MNDSIKHADYLAARDAAALYEPTMRGLLQVTGKDRAAWLHNLVTNQVKTLQPGQGNYAFALNVKGRILFDLNIIVLPDAIWLDIDRRWLEMATSHLNRYAISEDVKLENRSDDFARFVLLGPAAREIVDALGATQLASSPQLASESATLVQKSRLIIRHDLGSVFGAELFIEPADRDACRKRLLEIGQPVQLRSVSDAAVETLRIETGIPASLQDIDEEVLSAETQQMAGEVSFTKGCYLGQEVVERMRSHNVLARKLVGLRLSAETSVPTPLQNAGVEVGRLTSAVYSPLLNQWIGLGYVKTSHAAPETQLTAPPNVATVTPLPFQT